MLPSEEKNILRQHLITQRLELSGEDRYKSSEKILNMLSVQMDFKNTSKVHVYSPVQNEVDTSKFIEQLRHDYSNIEVEIAPIKTSASDVPEGNNYDMVVVPMVGFDRRGFRLGYGGGYYDRFLAQNNCEQIIGFAYSFSEVEKLPAEPHDIKMHQIITEEEVIKLS